MRFLQVASSSERSGAGIRPVDYDAELQRHDEVFRRACAIVAHERVLDVGCGAGRTTRDAARAASAGSATGVDVSEPVIALARELAAAEGVRNVRFELGDAQTHALPPRGFDVAISRFGTMFFADPGAAFRNIRGALADDGRLVMLVWQAREANEWAVAIDRKQEPGNGPDAFSLADPRRVRGIVEAAGFAQVTFHDVHVPVYYGDSVEAALDWVGRFQSMQDALRSPQTASAERERLRAILARHRRDDGVWFDSRAWIVGARCDRGGS